MSVDRSVMVIEGELHEDECDLAVGCHCGLSVREERRKLAERIVSALRGAGVVVATPPEPVISSGYLVAGIPIFEVKVPSPDGRGQSVTGRHVPGCQEDRVSMDTTVWWDLDRARADALRVLAACDAVKRLRAEHSGGESR